MRKTLLALIAAALVAVAGHGARSATVASPTYQFPTGPWQAYAPARVLCGELLGANFNSSADQAIPISVPSPTYMLDSIDIDNASVSLTTAAGGFYTAASKGGVAVVASSQAYSTLTGAANDASGSAMTATLATAGQNNRLDLATLYFSLTTAQGAAATADIRVYCRPHY